MSRGVAKMTPKQMFQQRRLAAAKFSRLVDQAIDTVEKIMRDEKAPHVVRLKAADIVFDRALGKPHEMHAVLMASESGAVEEFDYSKVGDALKTVDDATLRKFQELLGQIDMAKLTGPQTLDGDFEELDD